MNGLQNNFNSVHFFSFIATVTTFVGSGNPGYINGIGTAADITPSAVAADSVGIVYIITDGVYVRKITAAG